MKTRKTIVIAIVLFLAGWVNTVLAFSGGTSLSGAGNIVTLQDGTAEITSNSVPNVIPRPKYVRGIYLTGWGANNFHLRESVIALVRESGLNSLVINVKDDDGYITYKDTNVQLAREAKANINQVDMRAFLTRLRAERIYPIARIVVAKDKCVSQIKPEWFLQDKDRNVWKDKKNAAWADLRQQGYWDYLIEIAIEARDMGFREIQFDYVRWPSGGDGKISQILDIPSANLTATGPFVRSEVIADFLAYAREHLEPYGLEVSADTFGIMGTVKNEQTVGQQLEVILQSEVHAISPMIYPSHYWAGTYDQPNPNRAPYEVARQSALDHLVRMDAVGSKTILRPWLQDFEHWEDKSFIYGVQEIHAQLLAMEELGIKEYLFWNAENIFTEDAYKTWAMGRFGQSPNVMEKFSID